MKKKVVALMISAMMAATVIGCGDANNNAAEGTETVEESTQTGTAEAGNVNYESPAFDLNGEDYVTLCDYDNMPITISGNYTVEDADVNDYFSQMFSYYGPFYTVDESKTTVEEGDIVNVDYVGKLDGTAFDGGTAENQNIDVYNNSAAGGANGYIDGFTEGLKGASVGDVIDCDVTFPEDYGQEDLAGKAVVFTFTVNSIQKEITIDDIDDAFAKEQFQAETVDDMYAQVRAYLESTASNTRESDIYNAIQNYLLDNCTVEVPEDYLAARVNDFETQFVQNNCGGDASQLESFISTNYGRTLEEARLEWESGMIQNISLEFIMEAIAKAENIEIDEDGFASYVQNVAGNNGYESTEDLYKYYGYDDAAYGEQYMRQIYLDNMALQSIKDNAVVTEVTQEAESVEPTEEAETTEE